VRGKVVTKKSEIPAMGWWAQFATPDGCLLFLWQAPPQQPAV